MRYAGMNSLENEAFSVFPLNTVMDADLASGHMTFHTALCSLVSQLINLSFNWTNSFPLMQSHIISVPLASP